MVTHGGFKNFDSEPAMNPQSTPKFSGSDAQGQHGAETGPSANSPNTGPILDADNGAVIPYPPPVLIHEAARFYRDVLDWAVLPLHRHDDESLPEKERGKKPVLCRWPNWSADRVTDQLLTEYWGNGKPHNIGVVLRDGHVVIDLDSKQDSGASAQKFLDANGARLAVLLDSSSYEKHLAR